jgi:hypothetical protein
MKFSIQDPLIAIILKFGNLFIAHCPGSLRKQIVTRSYRKFLSLATVHQYLLSRAGNKAANTIIFPFACLFDRFEGNLMSTSLVGFIVEEESSQRRENYRLGIKRFNAKRIRLIEQFALPRGCNAQLTFEG